MYIKINDRDVAPQNVAEAALEKEIRSIHFELNEQFSFDNAFEAMIDVRSALGRVQVGEPEVKASLQTELDFSQGALVAGNEISGSEQSQPEIEGDVAVSLVGATLTPDENENEPAEETKVLEEAKAEAETKVKKHTTK